MQRIHSLHDGVDVDKQYRPQERFVDSLIFVRVFSMKKKKSLRLVRDRIEHCYWDGARGHTFLYLFFSAL